MPVPPAACALAGALVIVLAAAPAQACRDPANGLGVARIVEIDATSGPVFGFITKQPRERSFLGPKEIVLTFDDGPLPGVTRAILDTLDQFCTKATFFSVGRMAAAYPDSVRDIVRRGHTLGTHTWSHPMSLPRLSARLARDQIEAGFAAVATAAGQPIAPFFRFPGLNDSGALVQHLAARNIAVFTVDVVSNDSYIAAPERLIAVTLERLEVEGGGIVLFHDIKPQTARALPTILAEVRRRGYKVVHMRPKEPFTPDPGYVAAVARHIADKRIGPARPALVAVTDAPEAPAPETEMPPPHGSAMATVAPPGKPAEPETVTRADRRRAALPLRERTVEPATEPARLSAPPTNAAAPVARAAAREVPRSAAPIAAIVTAAPQSPLPVGPPTAKDAVASPKPVEVAGPTLPQVEVIAGRYPSQPVADTVAAGSTPMAPSVIAGSYPRQPAPPRGARHSARSWQDDFARRIGEAGN
jgi:peptidoglycan/xylan/chitin deacetylase (PgdA/CDA1 family)